MQHMEMEVDAANSAALASLQAQGATPIASFRPRMSLCPHCHEGFGSASLPIHVRRCRALLPDPEAEAKAAADALAATTLSRPVKKRQVPKLVDLCLAVFTRNFQGMCMDKLMVAPEHEAALIDALPTDLVHRIIANLVFENKKLAAKTDKERLKTRQLQKEVEDLQVQRGQLESFRHQSTVYRSRLAEQEQTIDRMRREQERMTHQVTVLEQRNGLLQSQLNSSQKTRQRFDTRMNTLAAENDELKQQLREARKKESELTKRLASAARATPTATSRHPTPARSSYVSSANNNNNSSNSDSEAPPAHRTSIRKARSAAPRPQIGATRIPLPRSHRDMP
ncbi:hypothetical protein PINS_up000752 [Pythium insidiosum]|nr:hypothetical protein PINS_up000752 [Pythium insidiosum]